MNRYITFVVYLALLISYCRTFRTQDDRDGCNYSYQKFPANSTCNLMEEGSAIIGCEAIGICNTFTVLWFKHTIGDRIIVNGSEHGSKYQVLTTVSQFIADCRCQIGTTLMIHRFNHSDNGYYSCQIDLVVSDNSRLLQSSPSGYVALGETTNERSMTCKFEHQLPTPMCAEDATSIILEETRCPSESLKFATFTTSTGPYSTHIYNTNSVTSMVTLPETEQQNMVWVYGLMIVFVLVIIILVLSLVLVSIKCRTQQKRTSTSHCSEYRTAQEVLNPHYVKTSLADNNVGVNKEEPSTPSNTHSNKNEEQSQSAETAEESNNGDNIYKFANYCNSQKKAVDSCHESSGYAAANTAKHSSLRIENSVQNSIGNEWFSPGYDVVGCHEVANKTVVIEQVNPLLYIEPQERCSSPVYAEVHKDKKKKQQQDHSVVIDEREGNQSPEYSQVQSFNKHSKDIVYQENQEDEQHYYHSLENPAEHGNNKIVFINKHSQEPQIISTLSMLCKTPGPADPDATDTHTEINDSESEFNTFPNPCYDHTQRHTDD